MSKKSHRPKIEFDQFYRPLETSGGFLWHFWVKKWDSQIFVITRPKFDHFWSKMTSKIKQNQAKLFLRGRQKVNSRPILTSKKNIQQKKIGWQPRKCKTAFGRSNRKILIISCHNITTLILEDKNWWETIHSFVTVLPKDGWFTFPMLASIFFE